MSWPSGTFTMEDLLLFSDDNSNQTQEISRIGGQNVVKEMVGFDLGKSSNNKQKKLRSNVWKNFEKYIDENGKERAKCNICKKSYNGSSKMGTTHLRNHFNICRSKCNEGGGSASGDKPAENSVMDQQLNHLDSVKMFPKQSSGFEPFLKYKIAAGRINEEKEKPCIHIEKLPCRLSLMIIIDHESISEEYICFSVHFIDDDWKLKEKIISLKRIGGDPIMKILENVVSKWGIDNKISCMVLDDFSYGYVMSSNERENWLSSQGSRLSNGKLFYIRDFHYISRLYSLCIYQIEDVLYDRMKEIFKYITGIENFRIAIDRARSLGKKVTAGVIPTEQELENMDYRVVDLLKIAVGLKEAFFELESMDIEFKSINLTKEEWDQIMTVYDLKAEALWYDYKTANMYFPWLCSTYMVSLELVKLNSSIYNAERFQLIVDGMKCWYDDNLVLAVAAVLDPRFKLGIVKHWYKKIYGGECETRLAIFTDYLTGVYNEYAKGTNNFQSSALGSEEKKSAISNEMLDHSGKPRKFSHDHHRSPNTELHLYLEDIKFPLIRDFNILNWWRFNTQYFPTLARMARDFLSIQITIPYCYLNSRLRKPHEDF